MTQKRVGVIGWPISHSLSPAMHNAAFAALGMTDWLYDAIAIPPDIVGQSIKTLRDEGLYLGINVTVPHKQAVMPFVRHDERARAIGAVNTIKLTDMTATNTDVTGFMDDLAANGFDAEGKKVIILGAGGAARAAVYGLAEAGAQVIVVNRTMERARDMLIDMSDSSGGEKGVVMTIDEAAEQGADLIVNCTSVGMIPNVEENPWIGGVPFPRGVTVYDMVYRPAVTRFMQQAESHGGQAIGGLGMLVRQGAAAFEIWTGVKPPVDVMRAAAEEVLNRKN